VSPLLRDITHSPNRCCRIGLGGIIPTDIEDGSFTKRIPTSDDKLLQQLIGKKKAKAHIIAKQEAARPQAANKAQRYGKPTAAKKEESEDEEGRAATFKSKRQRKEAKKPAKVDSDDEDEETRAKRLAAISNTKDKVADGSASKEEVGDGVTEDAPVAKDAKPREDDKDEEAKVTQPAPKRAKTKPKSFLDEILADRSKKKGKKSKA
jgi:hypothetical protein